MERFDKLNKYCYNSPILYELLNSYASYVIKPERSSVFLRCVRNYTVLENIGACFRDVFGRLFLNNAEADISVVTSYYYGYITDIQRKYIESYWVQVLNSDSRYKKIFEEVKKGDRVYNAKDRAKLFSEIIDGIDTRHLVCSKSSIKYTSDKNELWIDLQRHLCIYLCVYELVQEINEKAYAEDVNNFNPERGYQQTIEFHKFIAHYSMALMSCTGSDDDEYLHHSVWLGMMHLERSTMDMYKYLATNLVKSKLLDGNALRTLLDARQLEFNNKSGFMAAKATGYHNFFTSTRWYNGCKYNSNDCNGCFMKQQRSDDYETI